MPLKQLQPAAAVVPSFKANVVLAIADQLERAAHPVSMDTTVLTASLANPVIAVPQPDQLPNWYRKHQSNARAKLLQATVALQAAKETMDHPEMAVHPVPMENQAIKDHVDHLAHPDQLAVPARKELQAKLVNSLDPNQVHPVTMVPMVNQVPVVPLASPARLAKMVLQALLVHLATLVPLAVQAKLAPLVVQATLANQVHPAVANTAHRLVWLQVIKYLKRLANIIDGQSNSFDQEIAKNMFTFEKPFAFLLIRSMSF